MLLKVTLYPLEMSDRSFGPYFVKRFSTSQQQLHVETASGYMWIYLDRPVTAYSIVCEPADDQPPVEAPPIRFRPFVGDAIL